MKTMKAELICPICKRMWSICPHASEDYIPIVYSAREWAGKMLRRAQKAEREMAEAIEVAEHNGRLVDSLLDQLEETERELAELKAKTEETVERR